MEIHHDEISRLKMKWDEEYKVWCNRDLSENKYVYWWVVMDLEHTVICLGESLTPQLVKIFYRAFHEARLYNYYGPSEACVFATARYCPINEKCSRVSIGKPIAANDVYILDQNQQLLPINVPGEIYIAGPGVATGYLNRADLTCDKFVMLHEIGKIAYRTGDLASWLPSGEIDFCGRVDHQVKFNGIRIELEEIENLLEKHPAISLSMVMLEKQDGELSQLHAFIKSEIKLDKQEIRKYLAKHLISSIIPSHFHFVDEIPLNPNGKKNRSMTSLLLENNKNKKVLSNCFYRPNWEKYTPMSYHHDESATCDLLWICFDWNGQLRNYFNNDNMIFIDFSELSGDLAAFFSCIIDAKPSCCRFITCLPQVETTDIIHFVQNWIWDNLINFIKHYHSVIKSIPIEICSITQNLFEVSSLNNIYVPLQALLVSTIYALSAEFPNTTFKMLDIHSISEVMNNNFLSQFNLVPTNSYLTWRNQQHWILRYQQVFIPNFISGKLALSNGDVYVLIGFGGIAIELAKYFVENVSCHIIFLTRKVVISVEKESDLEQIRQKASTVELMQVDVTDEKSLEETFANIQKRFTFITGVINTTGIFSAKTLRELTFSDWKDVLKPKLQGAISLLNVIKSIDLKFCYFFSSSTTLKYTIGTFSYYSANLFLDYYLRQFSSDARIRNIKWGMWQDVGMSNLERMENPTEEFHHFRQYFSFLPEEARMLFDKALACDCAELLITAEPLEGTDLKTKNLSVNDQVLEKMKAIWLSVLKVDSLNYNDNFFELGGHSLMAAQLINKINKTFSSKLNLQQLFHSPTLLGLAANLE